MVTSIGEMSRETWAAAAASDWPIAVRLAFRFSFVYISLYVLLTFMLPTLLVPALVDFELGAHAPVRQIVLWTATHVFRVASPIVITGSGSGDKIFDWVETFCVLVGATAATGIWSLLDRRRRHYTDLHKWFRLFVRFAVGSTMFVYGFDKVVPLQMPYPGLMRLVEPFGNFSQMAVLWASIGASTAYQMFVGAAEIVGGLLVMIPRTALLGALVSLLDAVEIFALNMTYDVPVKLFSFHLILFTLFLIAPDARRLWNLFAANRAVEPSTQPALFRGRRANRLAVAAQLLFIAYLAGVNLHATSQAWTRFGGGAPKSPLYGIWNVGNLTVDGADRPALVSDSTRWRRVIFDQAAIMGVQQMDDALVRYGASVDTSAHAIDLARPTDPKWQVRFAYQRASEDRLVLDGAIDGRTIHAELARVDPAGLLLVKGGFHWIQEYPFIR